MFRSTNGKVDEKKAKEKGRKFELNQIILALPGTRQVEKEDLLTKKIDFEREEKWSTGRPRRENDKDQTSTERFTDLG